jgi:bifunctional non-homologous end joining protein LigD
MTTTRPSLSSPGKVLWPEPGYTKQDLWDYVDAVGERLLTHVRDRPLTLKRFPDGVAGEGFFQKNLPTHAPASIARHEEWTPTSKRTVAYAVARSVDDLRWMANQAALEFHPWFARTDRPERADWLVFDLDPGDDAELVTTAACWMRDVLDELGLASLVKTSGKRGLHLYVPIQRRYEFGDLRAFALATARLCADRHPDELTVEMRKAERGGRLLLDWSRAGPSQTSVAAWSPRATSGATVSTPLDWDEVRPDLDPARFTIATAADRPDPWADPPPAQRLERARTAVVAMGYEMTDRSPRARTG